MLFRHLNITKVFIFLFGFGQIEVKYQCYAYNWPPISDRKIFHIMNDNTFSLIGKRSVLLAAFLLSAFGFAVTMRNEKPRKEQMKMTKTGT